MGLLRRILLLAPLVVGAAGAAETGPKKTVAVAVVVHAKNPVTDLSLNELRAILRMERQFWGNGKRAVLYLRPSESVEQGVLLDKVYRMSAEKLQKYWVTKLFSGEIPAKPSYVPNSESAVSRVRSSEGAISVILATDASEGVRVLTIGGAKPGDKGYPLVAEIPAGP